MRRIIATPAAFCQWLCYGLPGVGADTEVLRSLAPSSTHWCVSSRNADQVDADASVPALAGLWCAHVAFGRHNQGLPVALPPMGKVIGLVKNVRAVRTQEQVVALVRAIVAHWPAIQSALGNFGASLVLDYGAVGIAQVVAQAERLLAGQEIARPAPAFRTANTPDSTHTLTPEQEAAYEAAWNR